MHDSGQRQQFGSGAVRDTATGKSRPDLISPYANMRTGEWMRLGAEKYSENNWTKGIPISRCVASLCRHLEAYKMGLTDEDHLAAIVVNGQFIMHYEAMIAKGLLPDSLNDMPKYEQQHDNRLPEPEPFDVMKLKVGDRIRVEIKELASSILKRRISEAGNVAILKLQAKDGGWLTNLGYLHPNEIIELLDGHTTVHE
jgi:hypothetical protein